ncbi:MAG: hypothetical protein F4X57_03240 [Chloroflexi bacterium]|nr:hypothetical protein [Chloroflexota bacterium]
MKMDGGRFYVGQTQDLRERISEHRVGNTKSTAGKNPKLVWFAQMPSRDCARSRTEETCRWQPTRNPTNGSQISRPHQRGRLRLIAVRRPDCVVVLA